jgi:hypothetical protein
MDVKREREGYKRIKRNYMNFFLGTALIVIGGFRLIADKESEKWLDISFIAVGIAYLIYGIVVWIRQK